MRGYIVDSNFWINAGQHYPRDIFPSLWNAMETLIKSGEVIIHQTVMDEIDRKEDEVSAWLHSIDGYTVMPVSESALEKYLECCQWAEEEDQGYARCAIEDFKKNDRADAWICAEAAVSGFTIVTNEKRSNSPNVVKIPNVCNAFDIDYMSNFDYMRLKEFSF